MSVTCISKAIAVAIDDCSNDEIGCRICPFFRACESYISTFNLPTRTEGEIVEKINSFRYYKKFVLNMEKPMTVIMEKLPQHVIDAVQSRWGCPECQGKLMVKREGRRLSLHCPTHPDALPERKW